MCAKRISNGEEYCVQSESFIVWFYVYGMAFGIVCVQIANNNNQTELQSAEQNRTEHSRKCKMILLSIFCRSSEAKRWKTGPPKEGRI